MKLLPATSLAQLPVQQLQQIKKLLDKFFFSVGTNAALYQALSKSPTQNFEKRVTQALTLQIFHVVQLEKIVVIMQDLTKQDSYQLENDWLSFDQAIVGGKLTILAFLLFAADEGGQAGLDKMVPHFTFSLRNEAIKQELEARVAFLGKVLDETSRSWVVKAIKQGMTENLTAVQIVRQLRQQAKEVSQIRASLITENELATAMSLLELKTYQNNGIEKVLWKTSQDEKVEAGCLLNEQAGPILLGSKFPMGGICPPLHVRCRCFLLPVLPFVITGGVWTGE